MLTPGDYVLWIYENTDEKNSSILPCSPFTFSLTISNDGVKEDYLTCQAPDLPRVLSPSMLDEPDGFLHYSDRVRIDLERGSHLTTFSVTVSSFFKVFTEAHRIDIDLKLVNADTGQIIDYVYKFAGNEEVIAVLLPPANYNLTFIYFGTYVPRFCETFYVEIALSPQTLYPPTWSFCQNGNTTLNRPPDLSSMQTDLNNGNIYDLKLLDGPYYFNYNGVYSQQSFLTQNFTITAECAIFIDLGDSFLLGDIHLALYSFNNDSSVTYIQARSESNRNYIRTSLFPGTYQLVLSTGPSSKSTLPGFPPCAEYTLVISIQPLSLAPQCWQYDSVPETFNTISYLGLEGVMHVAKAYGSPFFLPGENKHSQEIFFTVNNQSFFRIWTEPHVIDVDFILTENGRQVAAALRLNVEEELMYVLLPGRQYVLTINYWHWERADPHYNDPQCFEVDLEYAISPVSPNGLLCPPNLPPSNYILPPNGTISQWFAHDEFYFTQTSTSQRINLSFSSTVFTLFRATIHYDFVWTDVSLILLINNGTSIYADNRYGSKDISTLVLPPGYYTLQIYEPAAMTLGQYRRCTRFQLTIGWRQTDSTSGPSSLLGCKDAYLPPNFSILPYLGFTQGQVHFQQDVLIDVVRRRDWIEFNLTKPSLFSINVPVHTVVDIDLVLSTGTITNPGTSLDQRLGYNEEVIYYDLNPGQYVLIVRYYGFSGSPLPSASDCVYFPTEISIMPNDVLESVPAITQSCNNSALPPSTLVLNVPFENRFSRSLDQSFQLKYSFTTLTASLFDFNLRYEFLSGLLSVRLDGLVDEGLSRPVPRRILSQSGYNHLFIHEILPKGQYNLTIYDPRSFAHREPNLHCAQYVLSYLINTTGVPDNFCQTNSLPTDLFSSNGGSDAFGGPQNIDGSVRIYGENFLLSTPNGFRENFILFQITQPSFMRIFTHSNPPNDIDFYIYQNASRNTAPIYYSLGVDSVETKLWHFVPQTAPYLLDIYYFYINPNDPCPTYTLQIAIRTETQVANELLCPQILPSPEVPSAVYDVTGIVWEHNDNYYFTNERIQGNTFRNIFTYRILLNVLSNATLYTSVGFDFLANDFRLYLRTASDSSILASGYPSVPSNADSYINFYNGLFYSLTPGQYYLDIQEDLSSKDIPFTSYCHRFGFFLMVLPTSNNTAGVINFVSPPSGDDLDPEQDLTISISFSQYVAIPSPSEPSLPQWIASNQAIYLDNPVDPALKIYPVNAIFNSDHDFLSVVFSKDNLDLGQSYTLQIQANAFQTRSGHPFFLLGSPSFVYNMHNCACNGHGTCVNGSCVCDVGYAGEDCASCARGYHGAGILCLPNINCAATTCNGNGDCDDSSGTPQCHCYSGFTSTDNGFCSACAIGYRGYPNCTVNSDVQGDLCNAPILPTTFDSIGYLGFNQQFHIQADYYIDIDHFTHEITFTLTQDSVFRLYAEPHWVDVDAWLYLMDGTRQIVIDYAIKWNEEEVIFRTLSGSSPFGITYKLKFNYYVWDTNRIANCETFNLELAISPISIVRQEINNVHCSGLLPSPPNSVPGTYLPLPDGYNYSPSTLFSIVNNQTAPVPNFFYAFDFQVNPPSGSVAYFNSEIAYQFLPSDLSLMLEAGGTRNQCNGRLSPLCIVGSNALNRNHISEFLAAGNYTLWVYEPELQNATLTACAPFEFSAYVKYIPLIEDIYYCSGSKFPTSFNSPGYLDFNGFMHVQERFLLLDSVQVSLDLTVSSSIRVNGMSHITTSFAFYDNQNNLIAVSQVGYSPTLFVNLAPGSYVFKTISFFFNNVERCPSVLLEMEIAPSSTSYSNTCPGTETLPSLGTITLPFFFPAAPTPVPTSFYAFTNNPTIRQWTFYLNEPAYISAHVTSHFLTAALSLELVYQEQNTERYLYGTPNYNQNILREILDRGSYTFRIIRSQNNQVPPINFPPCAEFHFEFSLVNLTQAALNPCSQSGEYLPSTFNSIRFLGLDGEFDYQSSQFQVPSFNGFTSRDITLTVTEPSIFRVYSEPHIVDIDLVLYDNRSPSPVAHGGYTFNNEESIIYALEPNVNYIFRLLFWKWVPDIPACPVFNMEVTVSRIHSLSPLCPLGADSWPQGPPSTGIPDTPYIYNSMIVGKTLYFQQRLNQARSSPIYNFTLSASTNFYARLGFDFLSGDLVLKLEAFDLQTTYYGQNSLNGYFLKINSLPPGSYALTIYEPSTNLQNLLGCSYFTFELYIESDTIASMIPLHPYLPSTLDSISYLSYDGQIHLQDDFSMFDGQGLSNQAISFSLTQESLVRVSTAHYIKDIEGIQINIYQGTSVYSSHIESLLQLMPPGTYLFNFRRPYETEALGTIYPSIEIAISPSSALSHDLVPFNKPCTDSKLPTITPNPQGLYIYNNPNLMVSMTTLQSQPIIQTLSFVLKVPSLVYIQVQYQFLLTPLQLNITGYTLTYDYVSIVGINYRNLNSINDLLPPGSYTLTINQPGGVLFTYGTQFPFCGPYAVRIFIRPSQDDSTHVDCSLYSVVPWNLDTVGGGSVPFGGPIDRSGSIHMAGENFLIPEGTHPIDTITFTVLAPSYFVVVARETYYGDLIITLARGTSMKLILKPVNSISSNYQTAVQFYLDTPGTHELYIQHPRPSYYSCPYFALQILMEPVFVSGNRSLCDSNTNTQYPNQLVVPDTQGFYFQRIDSLFQSSFISQNMVNNQFRYDINITATRGSRIYASVAFNSLVSLFNLQVFQRLTSWTSNVAYGEYRMQRTHSGSTNLNQVLSGTLARPGNYTLRLSALFDASILVELGRQLCYPFIFSLLIVPNDGSIPIVNNISPPGGDFLSPSEPIMLTIDFSAPIYRDGVAITNFNPSLLYPAFSLDSSQNSVACELAIQLSSTSWKLIFNGPFYPSLTYKLVMAPSVLQDSNGRPIQMYGQNSYSMLDVSCSGHGVFDSGYCFCSSGYAGRQCETCEIGYKLRYSDFLSAWECAKCTSSSCVCFIDSCSCEPGISPCKPLGTCYENAQHNATCNCLPGYGGDYCQTCSPGYENYPYCDKQKVCPDGTAPPNCEPIVNGETTYASIEITRYLFVSFAFAILIVTIVFIVWKRFLAKKTLKGDYGTLNEDTL